MDKDGKSKGRVATRTINWTGISRVSTNGRSLRVRQISTGVRKTLKNSLIEKLVDTLGEKKKKK